MNLAPPKEADLLDSGLIVFSDLDATLLDEAYSWKAASPALEMLQVLNFPLILSSSKTLDEMEAIARDLNTGAPLICENGGIVAFPDSNESAPYRTEVSGIDRDRILHTAHTLRASNGYKFEGFADWTMQQVCELTGLSEEQAERSMNRIATEPILWKDDEVRWDAFEKSLHEEGISTVRGGRFIHLVGSIDKAKGMASVLEHYRTLRPKLDWTVVALGDSPNDLAMLSAADIAIVIPNKHHGTKLAPTAPTVIHAEAAGPTGWNTAMSTVLEPYMKAKKKR